MLHHVLRLSATSATNYPHATGSQIFLIAAALN
jgi:hypothetical protein